MIRKERPSVQWGSSRDGREGVAWAVNCSYRRQLCSRQLCSHKPGHKKQGWKQVAMSDTAQARRSLEISSVPAAGAVYT